MQLMSNSLGIMLVHVTVQYWSPAACSSVGALVQQCWIPVAAVLEPCCSSVGAPTVLEPWFSSVGAPLQQCWSLAAAVSVGCSTEQQENCIDLNWCVIIAGIMLAHIFTATVSTASVLLEYTASILLVHSKCTSSFCAQPYCSVLAVMVRLAWASAA